MQPSPAHPARFWSRSLPILFALLLLPAVPAAAKQPSVLDDPAFCDGVRQGLDRLYDMDFAGANVAFAEIEQRYTGHPVGPFLRALPSWWEILIDPDDESHDKPFFKAMDEVIDRSDRRLRKDKDDLDALFFKAGALAFRGRLHTDRKNWLRAARDGQKALSLLKEVRKRDPENPDLLLGIGLFNYLADIAPKQYPILKPFARLFPKGNRVQGLEELAQAVEKGKFVPTEAAFCLLQINYIFEKDYATSLHYARWLRQRYPNNSLFHVYEGRSFARLNLWPDARRDLLDILDRSAQGKTGYRGDIVQQALYVLGRDEVRWRQYADAIPYFERLEGLPTRGSTDSNYKAYGRLYRGMALDAMGRRDEALFWYKRVLTTSNPPDEARDKARGYVRNPYAG